MLIVKLTALAFLLLIVMFSGFALTRLVCRVALEVDQQSGSTCLLEADRATGSTYLCTDKTRAKVHFVRQACSVIPRRINYLALLPANCSNQQPSPWNIKASFLSHHAASSEQGQTIFYDIGTEEKNWEREIQKNFKSRFKWSEAIFEFRHKGQKISANLILIRFFPKSD